MAEIRSRMVGSAAGRAIKPFMVGNLAIDAGQPWTLRTIGRFVDTVTRKGRLKGLRRHECMSRLTVRNDVADRGYLEERNVEVFAEDFSGSRETRS